MLRRSRPYAGPGGAGNPQCPGGADSTHRPAERRYPGRADLAQGPTGKAIRVAQGGRQHVGPSRPDAAQGPAAPTVRRAQRGRQITGPRGAALRTCRRADNAHGPAGGATQGRPGPPIRRASRVTRTQDRRGRQSARARDPLGAAAPGPSLALHNAADARSALRGRINAEPGEAEKGTCSCPWSKKTHSGATRRSSAARRHARRATLACMCRRLLLLWTQGSTRAPPGCRALPRQRDQ